MNLREAYAAVLQMLRDRQALTQYDVANGVTQSQVSRLESRQSNPTLETSRDLANALNLHPLAFLALVHAADEQKTARELLDQVFAELNRLKMLDAPLPQAPTKKPHPRTRSAEEGLRKVQALKAQGKSQVEVIELLGMPRSTVSRYWRKV
ncbi:helix-turn-helix domain-containing protein [Pseudomonas taiwanensis]|uniref:DNA-binding protein n=1 Tax=Pseudomonas taiwanensis SJ9 TaxID=1388762 RepID=V7D592_9PSED|nr:helix-turn-helix transcriptional regulator [Pseudomonas taiwanensis]ESW36675.1 DNA-binding protein [Pseudomonas taiwanensis SJ9]